MISIKPILTCLVFILIIFKTSAQQQFKFVEDLKNDARIQINRIIDNYEIEDWVFTDIVKIVHGEDARSYPVLQINTDFLEDDEIQLSIFIHENAHIFIADNEKDEAENKVIRELRRFYPNPPEPIQKNRYHHIMVAWVEYDALIKLFNKDKSREIMNRKIQYYTKGNLEFPLFQNYAWYNQQDMDKSEKIGQLMNTYGFNIHPKKGIVVI